MGVGENWALLGNSKLSVSCEDVLTIVGFTCFITGVVRTDKASNPKSKFQTARDKGRAVPLTWEKWNFKLVLKNFRFCLLLSDCSDQNRLRKQGTTASPSAFSRDQLAHTALFGKCYFLLPNSILLFLESTLVFGWRYIYLLLLYSGKLEPD